MHIALVASGSPLSLPKILLRLEAEKDMIDDRKWDFGEETHLVEKSARVADKIKQLTVSARERDKSFLKVFCWLPGLNTWERQKRGKRGKFYLKIICLLFQSNPRFSDTTPECLHIYTCPTIGASHHIRLLPCIELGRARSTPKHRRLR